MDSEAPQSPRLPSASDLPPENTDSAAASRSEEYHPESTTNDDIHQLDENNHPSETGLHSTFNEIITSEPNSALDENVSANSQTHGFGTFGSAATLVGLAEPPAADAEQDPNSSVNLIHFGSSTGRQFATPLKLLPPLKDIETIVTPKSFGVAKDLVLDKPAVESSPVAEINNVQILPEIDEDHEDAFDATANDTFAKPSAQAPAVSALHLEASELGAAANFVGLEPAQVVQLGDDIVARLAQRAHTYQGIQSELSFSKLNQEHANQIQSEKCLSFQKKIDELSLLNESLRSENLAISDKAEESEIIITSLKAKVNSFADKLHDLESAVHTNEKSQTLEMSAREHEIAKLQDTVHKLTEDNVKLSQLTTQLTKDLNEVANEKFQIKLELTKVTNKMTYLDAQKNWYASQLKNVQDKYTELIKKHETEFLKTSTELSSLRIQNEALSAAKSSLESQVADLESKLDSSSTKLSDLESKFDVQKIKFSKESASNEQMIELIRVQLQEREKRISQLESYAEELKESATNSISDLQSELTAKEERIAQLEVKIKRTEEAFGAELKKEADLPRISSSAESILNSSNLGISLSALYTEFNLIKKELVLEKSQKEKLAVQLQHFVTELESKKPAIANYRNQVQFYELSLKEQLEKLDALRVEKISIEKECSRLRARVANSETEKQSLKQLLKDLGRQLCYYLIHSSIREGKDDPLSANERRVIDLILAKSGAAEGPGQTDTDVLISERLVAFASIIELQRKNEELVVAVRKLGRDLEDKDLETTGFEAAAVEEAKDAILTLQSELDSVSVRLDAVTKERDLLKSISPTISNGEVRGTDMKILSDANSDYKMRIKELDMSLKTLQSESSERIRTLTEKLLMESKNNENLRLEKASLVHSIELAEDRLASTKRLLENSQRIGDHTSKEASFWKEQASKQENMLVSKSNELRDVERRLFDVQSNLHNLEVERDLLVSAQNSFKVEINQLKEDKQHLTSFVANLQSILEEREASASDLSSKLSQSIVNYQALQDRINEKEERIQVLSSQSELSLKAQNSKLEQVNELSQKLLETKSKLAEKQLLVEKLKLDLNSCSTSHGISKPVDHLATISTHADSSSTSNPEYDDLKSSLEHAELQVQEFSNIARASEEALENATRTYEEYKVTASETLRLLEADKERLNEEIRAKDKEFDDLRQQYQDSEQQLRSEVSQLQAKVQESTFKVLAFDDMKQDMEQKLQSLNGDLQNQQALFEEISRRHESKLSEAELLNLQVAKQKDEIEKLKADFETASKELQGVNNRVASSELALKEKYAGIEEELLLARAKIADLQVQYGIALNQIELQNNGGDNVEGDSGEDLRQVVRFLRREKDTADAQNIQLTNDVQRLQSEFADVSFELNATKAQMKRLQATKVKLDESASEHSKLMEQLEQLNILRESNVTLRNESKNLQSRLEKSEETIQALESKLNSQSSSGDTQNAIDLQNLELLKEENERLKSQLGNNEEYKNLMQRFENLKAEFKTKLMGHRNKNKELDKELNETKSKFEAAQVELEAARNSQTKSQDDAVQQLRTKLTKLEAEKDVTIKKLNSDLSKLKQEHEKAVAEVQNATKSTNTDVEEEVRKLKENYEKQIASMNSQFEEKLAAEKKSVEESVEKKCDFKLRVLNRKVDRLEKEKAAREQGEPQPQAQIQPQNADAQTKQSQPVAQAQNNKRQFPSQGVQNPNSKKAKE
ncbi:hypothetical protein PUMCH_004512 [Australozyma saopauloensis]|uniref:NUA/TPR/MLP1-2-like domain-containing protein n=1 Tax=Australozyma saopauloensis TaxID=291208 RepID=A0AAX4HEY0_9ASCO|nr:hypothetical protein PUMCH_004512 [[Candida] saopauloensis]